MASTLDRIIDGAADSSVSVSNLLRLVLIAAKRVRADTVQQWADLELAGFENAVGVEQLPVYRRPRLFPVTARWSGIGSSATTTLTPADGAPEDWVPLLFQVQFRQPVSQLETIASTPDEGNLGSPWPAPAVMQWNEWVAEGQAAGISGMRLWSASTRIPHAAVVAVLDAVRTEALRLALDLQGAATDAGEVDGATVADPEVQGAVTQFITNVYDGSPTIAQGATVTQTVTVNVGDLASLTRAAESSGLANDALTDYVEAVLDARKESGRGKLDAFLTKVRNGTVALSGNIGANVAATQLLEWAKIFLGA